MISKIDLFKTSLNDVLTEFRCVNNNLCIYFLKILIFFALLKKKNE